MDASWETRVDRFVEAVRKDVGTPGVAVSVTDSTRTLFEKTYGFQNLEAKTALLPSHRIEFGSIGKSVTAILLLQLEREGRVSLDARVEEYLPWFQVRNRPPIALKHLLAHTSGLIGGTDFPPDARLEIWSLRDTETVWEPGARFHYSNAGFKTLGLILERITGRSYRELVGERILHPLGMSETDAVITHDTRLRLAAGYRPLYDDRPYWPAEPLVPASWIETDTADGCLSSTAGDLARYVRLYLNGGRVDGQAILDPASFARLIAPVIQAGPEERYALGIGRYGSGDGAIIGHSGGMLGYYAQILADPVSGFGVTVLVNGPGRPYHLAREILTLVGRAHRGEDLGPEPVVAGTVIEAPQQFVGDYRSAAGDVLQVGPAPGGELRVTWNGETMAPPRGWGEHALVAHHPALALFPLEREGDENETRALHHGGMTYWRAGREEDRGRLPDGYAPYLGHYRSHDPWDSNFRVVARGPSLYLIPPDGSAMALQPLHPERGHFRLMEDGEPLPEEVRFDTVVDGAAWACNVAGNPFARFFTP